MVWVGEPFQIAEKMLVQTCLANVCGKVAISVDKPKQPTKVTRFSDGATFTAITTRTDAYKFSFFP